MKRWKITYNDGSSKILYSDTKNNFIENNIKHIEPYINNNYIKYIDKIKQYSKFLGSINRNNNTECIEYYHCQFYKGYLIIKLFKDIRDNTYYPSAMYQEHTFDKLVVSILFDMSSVENIWEMINTNELQYITYSHRYYGEKKLSKPKELKGIKSIGSAVFIPKHSSPQIFMIENDIYIKHNDYFSNTWLPSKEEMSDMPTTYYLKKYFNKIRNDRFIYPDTWGTIVLRNEAWILLKDSLSLIKNYKDDRLFVKLVLDKQKEDRYSYLSTGEEIGIWTRFWESVYKIVKENITEK